MSPPNPEVHGKLRAKGQDWCEPSKTHHSSGEKKELQMVNSPG